MQQQGDYCCRNLTGNNLVGGLPSNWGGASVFQNLTGLDLSINPNLSGALPPNWGTQGAFTSLVTLRLGETGVSGQLPTAWGGQLSLPMLQALDLGSNLLDGMLLPGTLCNRASSDCPSTPAMIIHRAEQDPWHLLSSNHWLLQ